MDAKEAGPQPSRSVTRPNTEKASAKSNSPRQSIMSIIPKDEQFNLTSTEYNEFWEEFFAIEAAKNMLIDEDV